MQQVLLSTAYFPSISWMATAIQSEVIGIEIHETYPKQTFRNRCHIAAASGIHSLTVPVKRVNGNHTKTFDIQIDNSRNWQIVHWRSIVSTYNRSPYLLYYRDLLESLFHTKNDLLVELNNELLKIIFKALNINNSQIFYTSEYLHKTSLVDLRNTFHPKTKSDSIAVTEFPRYIQVFEEFHRFIPDLSILDLLFNLGPDAKPYLLKLKFPDLEGINE